MPAALMERGRSVLVVIDLQARLAPAIDGIAEVKRAAARLIRAGAALDVPVAFTEQNPKGLGPTDLNSGRSTVRRATTRTLCGAPLPEEQRVSPPALGS